GRTLLHAPIGCDRNDVGGLRIGMTAPVEERRCRGQHKNRKADRPNVRPAETPGGVNVLQRGRGGRCRWSWLPLLPLLTLDLGRGDGRYEAIAPPGNGPDKTWTARRVAQDLSQLADRRV